MNEEEAEKLMVQLSLKDKRDAVINGILYGIGFANIQRKPNWRMIKKLAKEGRDLTWEINIENGLYDIDKKVVDEQIELWLSMKDKYVEKEE